ncbi:MAG TPA: hypothetical protein VKH37_02245, partial [Ferruginibacter sp.]|nr:hypothetical protein [Ferruginibacter sp.]
GTLANPMFRSPSSVNDVHAVDNTNVCVSVAQSEQTCGLFFAAGGRRQNRTNENLKPIKGKKNWQ